MRERYELNKRSEAEHCFLVAMMFIIIFTCASTQRKPEQKKQQQQHASKQDDRNGSIEFGCYLESQVLNPAALDWISQKRSIVTTNKRRKNPQQPTTTTPDIHRASLCLAGIVYFRIEFQYFIYLFSCSPC